MSLRQLSEILPLDDESLQSIISSANKLGTQSEITEYFLGLLGESPAALDFISDFTSSLNKSGDTASRQAQPVRKPAAPAPKKQPKQPADPKTVWNTPVVSQPKLNNNIIRSKQLNSAGGKGTTTSELLPPPSKQKLEKQKSEKQRKVNDLKDLETILQQLELKDDSNGADGTGQRSYKCDCMATRHPLFDVVPNCLNCGKIICSKEGMRPCSFCGQPLISNEERLQIIKLIEQEKQQLETPAAIPTAPSSKQKKKNITISSGAGVNLWQQQDLLFKKLEKKKEIEAAKKLKQEEEAKEVKEQMDELQYYENQNAIDPDLLKAKKNLDNLLNFQANGAERTKIIDQASDFETPTGSNLNMWSSSVERTLQLKKQQKQRRLQEERERERAGRGKKVVDITIGKDGKAVLREVVATSQKGAQDEEEQEEEEDIKDLENQINLEKSAKAEQEFKRVWDYEEDAKKWNKPVYVNKEETSEEAEQEEEKLNSAKWDRIQSKDASNLEDLLVVM